MYQQYWGLQRPPFRPTTGDDCFYTGEVQEEALARLDFVIQGPQRLALLLGQPGMGKTLLFEHVARLLRQDRTQVVVMNLLAVDAEEFVFQLADGLAVDHRERHSYATIWRGLLDRLLVNRYQNMRTVLLFDDADEAEDEVLRNVVRLTQWRPGENTGLTIVLASKKNRVQLLGSRLVELADLRIDLYPWERDDVAGFLSHSVCAAGRDASMFDNSAVERLYQLTAGNPRRVRQLAELSLIAAAGQQLTMVNAATISAVQDELCAQSAAAA